LKQCVIAVIAFIAFCVTFFFENAKIWVGQTMLNREKKRRWPYIEKEKCMLHHIQDSFRNLILGAASHHPSQQGYSHAGKDASIKGI